MNVLSKATAPEGQVESRDPGCGGWLTRNFRRIRDVGRHRREQILAVVNERRIALKRIRAANDDPTLESLENLIAEAEQHAKIEKFDAALLALYAAGRMEIPFLNDPEIEARVVTLRIESKRLGQDQAEAITTLTDLADKTRDKEGLEGPELRKQWLAYILEAIKVRDDFVAEQFMTKRRVKRHIGWLSLPMFVFLLIVLSIFSLGGAEVYLSKGFPGWNQAGGATKALWLAAFLGALGACVSAMMNFTVQRRVPDALTTLGETMSRPLVGAVSGLVSALVLVTTTDVGPSLLAATAFAFGFSERLILGVVERVDPRTDKP